MFDRANAQILDLLELTKTKKEIIKMGKIKTHKASAKRFSVTASGKVKMGHCHHRHNTGLKTAKRKRHLRTSAILSESMTANIRTLIQK